MKITLCCVPINKTLTARARIGEEHFMQNEQLVQCCKLGITLTSLIFKKVGKGRQSVISSRSMYEMKSEKQEKQIKQRVWLLSVIESDQKAWMVWLKFL